MPLSTRVAVVTGANKGVGYHIAKSLIASKLFGTVILACRDANRGKAAAQELGGVYMPLVVGDEASANSFASELRKTYGRLDVLVNNAASVRPTCAPDMCVLDPLSDPPPSPPPPRALCALVMMAVAFKAADPTPFAGQTKPTLAVNYYGTMQVTKALLPLLLDSNAADPRIVNVASMAGKKRQLQPARQREFASPSLTIDALDSLVAEFEADVAAGKDLSAAGWGRSNCE